MYSTDHPQILKAKEIHYDWTKLEKILSDLQDACNNLDIQSAQEVFASYISGYKAFIHKEDKEGLEEFSEILASKNDVDKVEALPN